MVRPLIRHFPRLGDPHVSILEIGDICVADRKWDSGDAVRSTTERGIGMSTNTERPRQGHALF